jgi:hypothetical protein
MTGGGPDLLHAFARSQREVLLQDLAALTPLTVYLGAQAAVEETLYAIHDVAQWWA